MNLYADLGMFRRNFTNDAVLDASDAQEMVRRLTAASRRVDEHCRRQFFASLETRYFAGGGSFVRLPDLISATTVKLDEDGDRTYELTLTSDDYHLEREFYHDVDATPKTVIRLDSVNGQRSSFPHMRRGVEIVGLWGYTDATELTGQAVPAGDLADDATSMTLASAATFEVGQTLLIEDEQIYVSAVDSNELTIERGVNGTTAAEHAEEEVIRRFVYVPEVVDATLILAGRTWKRKDMAYANVLSNEVSGTTTIFRTIDPDAEQLLAPLRRWEA